MRILRLVYNVAIDTLQTFLMAAAVFLVIYIFLLRPFEVKGESMYPNFLDKQYVLTNLVPVTTSKVGIKFQEFKLGDVIVFKAPVDSEKDFIKRIIGVPGDSVMIKDGSVFLNGNLLDETPYLKSNVKTNEGAFLKEGVAVTVPEDSYIVFGDNRMFSSDSREWGLVKKDLIIGKSFFVYWPISDFKVVKNPYQKN